MTSSISFFSEVKEEVNDLNGIDIYEDKIDCWLPIHLFLERQKRIKLDPG